MFPAPPTQMAGNCSRRKELAGAKTCLRTATCLLDIPKNSGRNLILSSVAVEGLAISEPLLHRAMLLSQAGVPNLPDLGPMTESHD